MHPPHTKMATRQQMVPRLAHFIKQSNGNRWNLTLTSPSYSLIRYHMTLHDIAKTNYILVTSWNIFIQRSLYIIRRHVIYQKKPLQINNHSHSSVLRLWLNQLFTLLWCCKAFIDTTLRRILQTLRAEEFPSNFQAWNFQDQRFLAQNLGLQFGPTKIPQFKGFKMEMQSKYHQNSSWYFQMLTKLWKIRSQ